MSYLIKAAGPLLILSFVLTVFNAWVPNNIEGLQGVFTWLAGIILFFDLAVKQKKIILTIATDRKSVV